MKTFIKKQACLVLGLVLMFPAAINAQDKFETTVGADLVSAYIWRGQELGGVSIQPSISVGISGLSLTAWGSVGFDSDDDQELDFTLGYETDGFSVSVTDYYLKSGGKYFNYSAHSSSHVFEGTLAYDFGPLAICWNTNFAGNDYKEDEKRAYSSYFEISAPFKLGGIDFTAEVGGTPWEGSYAEDFAIVNIGVGASKDIKITDSFSLPAFAKVTFNPRSEGAYFAFGLSF